MTIQTINIGNQVNDGLGDDLRTAFQKVNGNFAELSASLTVTASNLSVTGIGIFKEKVGTDLKFKSLSPGTKITLDPEDDIIRINSSQPDAFTSITTNHGTVTAVLDPSIPRNTIDIVLQGSTSYSVSSPSQQGRNIKVRKTSDNTIEIDSVLDLNQILLSTDFGPIAGAYDHPIQFSLAMANIDFGTLTTPSSINLDFGSI